jgi:hypothetical protein
VGLGSAVVAATWDRVKAGGWRTDPTGGRLTDGPGCQEGSAVEGGQG